MKTRPVSAQITNAYLWKDPQPVLYPCDNERLAPYALGASLLLDPLAVDVAPPLMSVGAMRLFLLGC